MAVGRLPKQFEVLNPPVATVEVPPAVDNSEALKAMEDNAATVLAAYVETIKAEETKAVAEAVIKFPEYNSEN